MAESRISFSAVVLAGGTGLRMGGADKAALELHGRSLLDLALDALTEADEVAVTGPPAPTRRPVTFTLEDPPSGGPVAGLLAGRDALVRTPDLLAVLAVDMPRVDRATIRRLLAAAAGHDGAFLVDGDGRRQLCGVLRPERLEEVRPAQAHGAAVHRLLAGLDLVDVPGRDQESVDIDSWKDLHDLT
ncbi:molybdenum cofactor guanylyltransferase [Nocardioides houyundeii]|uniref:molybdenum cofactor guanylyltransferase n=1 Tax=Nocardioides houyundeii TaxID=2045452 RepID=UPI000DF26C6A|nr:NTP transferase domain-containing protein [Nocardioides houyundeii]